MPIRAKFTRSTVFQTWGSGVIWHFIYLRDFCSYKIWEIYIYWFLSVIDKFFCSYFSKKSWLNYSLSFILMYMNDYILIAQINTTHSQRRNTTCISTDKTYLFKPMWQFCCLFVRYLQRNVNFDNVIHLLQDTMCFEQLVYADSLIPNYVEFMTKYQICSCSSLTFCIIIIWGK